MKHGVKWLEASYRKRESRVRISALSDCKINYPCVDVCIELRPNGWASCRPKPTYDACGNSIEKTCPNKFIKVCASYIDEENMHIFVWPTNVLTAKEGFYTGVVTAKGEEVARLPVRVGAHPGATFAEGSVHTPINDCVTCDDSPDPCLQSNVDCGCDNTNSNTNQAYMLMGDL
jgi:hypothetical protein